MPNGKIGQSRFCKSRSQPLKVGFKTKHPFDFNPFRTPSERPCLDNSQFWVRISHGTVNFVVYSIQDNTEIPADPQEEQIPQTSTSVVAARSKAKAKPQPRESTGTTTIPLSERIWIDIVPSKQDLESCNLSKKVINLL